LSYADSALEKPGKAWRTAMMRNIAGNSGFDLRDDQTARTLYVRDVADATMENCPMLMPPTVDHFQGQPEAVALLKTALEAAWNDGTRLPHMLLTGPPGVGKTTLANLAAREMGVVVHERLGQTLEVPAMVNGVLMEAEDKDVVFVDEAHELPRQCQTVLYRAMEDRSVFLHNQQRNSLKLPLADFTLISDRSSTRPGTCLTATSMLSRQVRGPVASKIDR